MTTELSTMQLPELEAIIDRGLATFVEVGSALLEIRDGQMYGNQYETFDEYCQGRFGFTSKRAYQLISAAETVEELSTRVDKNNLPSNEMQTRTLDQVADTPARKAKVWKKAVKDAPKDTNGKPRITASSIKIAAGVLPKLDHEAGRAAAMGGVKSLKRNEPTPEEDGPDRAKKPKTPPAKTDNGNLGLFNAADQRAWRESYGVLHRMMAKAIKADFKKYGPIDKSLEEFFKRWVAANPGKWS